MASEIEICNRALSHLGQGRSINSLTEASKEAAQCSLHYPSARDSVLADFNWNFATKRVALAQTNNPPSDWQYAYAYPSDCLRIIAIPVPGIRHPTAEMRIQYVVGADEKGTGRLIYTDQPKAWLKYVAQIIDVNMFEPIFQEALSWRLASAINMAITANPDVGNNALMMYSRLIQSAGTHSMNESQEPPMPDSPFTLARMC